ncbi:hypothetical protein C8Q76DRAFT_602678, partial [Earliella scabrosa]
ILDEMDITSVLRWRATCKDNYQRAVESLQRTLRSILLPFSSIPRVLLQHISQNNGVIGGVHALAFILRDRHLRHDHLEIYTSAPFYDRLLRAIQEDPQLSRTIERVRAALEDEYPQIEREVSAITVLHLQTGRTITIYQSSTDSPCSPISHSSLSALMTFVTAHSFGCAYPRLTLRRRTLLSDLRLINMPDTEFNVHQTLFQAGFSAAIAPTAWEDIRSTDVDPSRSNSHHCLRNQYLCPQQGRYFGDRGSLVAFMD